MRYVLLSLALVLAAPPVWAGCPSRSFTYTAGETIDPSEVTTNEDNLYEAMCTGNFNLANGSVTSTAIADSTIAAADLGANAVTSAAILDDEIVNADVDSSAAIAFSKLATLTSGNLLVGSAGGVPTSVAMSGDVTIVAAGTTTIGANAVVLSTDTSGNFVATLADNGTSTLTIANSGTENAAVTAGVTANSIGATQLATTLTMADADFLNFAASNASSTTDGIRLPQNTSCASATAEGQLCWDTDGDRLFGGNGTVATPLHATIGTFTRDVSLTADQAVTGLGFSPKFVVFIAGIDGNEAVSFGMDNGTIHVVSYNNHNASAEKFGLSTTDAIFLQTGAGEGNNGEIVTLDTDGFTIDWTKVGSPTGTATIAYLASP